MLVVIFLLAALVCKGQSPDTILPRTEVLNSGFIDIISNGQVNASARLIRLYIGEPGRFSIPVSVYSGVSSNNFQNQQTISGRSNGHLANEFINPFSGLINISFEGLILAGRKNKKITKAGWVYHAGERLLTGYRTGNAGDVNTGKPVNFISSVFATGIYFQTGAWERNNAKNMGIAWSALRYIISYSSRQPVQLIMRDSLARGFFHGWSIGWGIEISNLVSIKILYYKYIKSPPVDYFIPICQISFNYTVKK